MHYVAWACLRGGMVQGWRIAAPAQPQRWRTSCSVRGVGPDRSGHHPVNAAAIQVHHLEAPALRLGGLANARQVTHGLKDEPGEEAADPPTSFRLETVKLAIRPKGPEPPPDPARFGIERPDLAALGTVVTRLLASPFPATLPAPALGLLGGPLAPVAVLACRRLRFPSPYLSRT
jgi:hypothetical protein